MSREDTARRDRDGEHLAFDPGEVRRVETLESLSGLLRHLRRRLARQHGDSLLTYRELAARTRWGHGVIGDYFAGKTLPPTDRFDTLVRLLGATPAEQGALATARDNVEELRRSTASAGGASAQRRPGGWPVPRQLPPDAFGFTGRAAQLATLDELVRPGSGRGPVLTCLLDGIGGSGTSALAIRAAHQIADRFPDGQLYADLLGNDPAGPAPPLVVLSRFLRALGIADAVVPDSVAEASALFRAQVATHRLLVVLDNAHDAAQVRALLPASSTCAVLVTSRQRLATVDHAACVAVDVLPARDAVAFLGRFAGPQRLAAERPAAGEIARLCGYLPLALRIAGARLAARPHWPIGALAERMRDDAHRLDALRYADLDIRATFRTSYDRLRLSESATDRAAASALIPLARPAGADLTPATAGLLLGEGDQGAELILERLVDARLLETPVSGRYRFPELLRLYARELTDERQNGPVGSGRVRP